MQVETNLQVRQELLVLYNIYPKNVLNKGKQDNFYDKNNERTAYSGAMTKGAQKRLTKCIELLVMASLENPAFFNPVARKTHSFQLSFITLTFPGSERINAKYAHKTVLEPFLQWMRRAHGCTMYIWKAELQKRGQLHYHITANCFIHYKEIRARWNALLTEHGYMDEFACKFGHTNPPSTEIKSVMHKKKLVGYLKKRLSNTYSIVNEMGKDLQNKESVGGKIWDCSLNLKQNNYFTINADWEISERINQLIKEQELYICYQDSHCTLYKTKTKAAKVVLSEKNLDLMSKYMSNVRNRVVERVNRPVSTTIRESLHVLKKPKKGIQLNVFAPV
jgi:hypothetical protein